MARSGMTNQNSRIIRSDVTYQVVMYKMNHKKNWEKAGYDGTAYLKEQTGLPRFVLVVTDSQDPNKVLEHHLSEDWVLDIQENERHYVFYKLPTGDVWGLWFQDGVRRKEFADELEDCLRKLRERQPPGPPPLPDHDPHQQHKSPYYQGTNQAPPMPHRQQAQMRQGADGMRVTLTRESLRSAMLSLADDENFLRYIMNHMRQMQ